MNRVSVANSAAMSVGCIWAALLSISALAAESGGKSPRQTSSVAAEQRLEAAQRRLERAAQEIADLSVSLSDEALEDAGATRSSRRLQRAVLGVDIGTETDAKRSDGVILLSVRRGGGAYEAGLKSGDLLLSVNDQPLKRDDDVSPREKLLSIMRGVEPGERVAVKYRREGFTKTVNVIARPIPDRPVNVVPRVARSERLESEESPKIAVLQAEGFLGNAELVPLTPRLGKYFGTDKGLLVVRAPSDENLDIQEGDVILEIDGRIPNSASHAIRILGSYQPGEELSLGVLRRKRRFDIDIVIPQDAPRAQVEQPRDRPRINAAASRATTGKASTPTSGTAAAEPAGILVQPLPEDGTEVESRN